MFLTDKMLKQMITEIKDDYLTQLPSTADAPVSASEESMEAFSRELDEIEIDPSEGVNFLGRGMNFDEMISIIGNYVVSHEQRHAGGAPMKHLRKGIKDAVRNALQDVPQMIADAIAEEVEPYIEEDAFDLEPATAEEIEDIGGW